MAATAPYTLGGSYLIGGGISMLTGGAAYLGTEMLGDWIFDTDDKLYDFIANQNVTDIDYSDPKLAQKHYEMIKNEADAFINDGNLKLNDLTEQQLRDKVVITDEMRNQMRYNILKDPLPSMSSILLNQNNQSINFGSSQATSPSAEVCNIRDYPPGWTP